MKNMAGKADWKTRGVAVAVAVAAITLLSAATAVALNRGPQGVTYTVHNLSSLNWENSLYYTQNEDEVCIFCHTPHGGDLIAPLWNRANPTNSYLHYNSASLSQEAKDSRPAGAVNNESLICLSCHDGSIATNRVLNESNRTTGGTPNPGTPVNAFVGGDMTIDAPFFIPGVGARIGASPGNQSASNDLTDDHPISFSYYDVFNGPEGVKLNDPSTITTVQFFGANAAGGLRVECSTCHDPHVNYDSTIQTGNGEDETYRPFLITPNTGSGLCLTCHIK